MVGDKIKYTCKNCGWLTHINKNWADLKPKRCMNKKCNTSFLKNPDLLIIQIPDEEFIQAPKVTRKNKKSESPDN